MSSQPIRWTFKCLLDSHHVNVIQRWYDLQSPALQAKFDTRIRFLGQQAREAWTRPAFDLLHGNCRGLGEIRFQHMNVQYRPLGYFSGAREFTLLAVATKQGRVYKPTCAYCLNCKSAIEEGNRGVCTHVYY